MADLKISQLTGATTPLAGTEVVPLVQSGTTKKVSVADLTAGRAIAALSGTFSGNVQANSTAQITLKVGPTTSAVETWKDATPTAAASVGFGTATGNTTSYKFDIYDGSSWGTAFSIDPTRNLVQGTAAKGINFTANTPAAGMTSQLLNWYEEGTWTPTANGITYAAGTAGKYTRVGNLVTCTFKVVFPTTANGSNAQIQGLPFNAGVDSAAIFGNYSDGFNGPLNSGNSYIGLVNTTGTAFIANSTLSGQTLVGSVTYQV